MRWQAETWNNSIRALECGLAELDLGTELVRTPLWYRCGAADVQCLT
jgi:hypothetical protein